MVISVDGRICRAVSNSGLHPYKSGKGQELRSYLLLSLLRLGMGVHVRPQEPPRRVDAIFPSSSCTCLVFGLVGKEATALHTPLRGGPLLLGHRRADALLSNWWA